MLPRIGYDWMTFPDIQKSSQVCLYRHCEPLSTRNIRLRQFAKYNDVVTRCIETCLRHDVLLYVLCCFIEYSRHTSVGKTVLTFQCNLEENLTIKYPINQSISRLGALSQQTMFGSHGKSREIFFLPRYFSKTENLCKPQMSCLSANPANQFMSKEICETTCLRDMCWQKRAIFAICLLCI